MQRVLLTGGAGYVGSHAAKCLKRNGFEPVTLDDLSSGHRWAVKWGPFVQGDIADAKLVRETVARYRIRAVLHLAAYASVGESMAKPWKYFQNNVTGSLRLLDALRDSSAEHIIFSSTCATYGTPQHGRIKESDLQNPVNPYGESKLMIEKALRWYGEAYGITSVCLRYFNAAGADPEGELGEVHNPETHLIPTAINTALGLCDSLEIYGRDYPTRDGSAVRDYTHVADLAEAHVTALQYLLEGGSSESVNLGTGHGYSVLEVIRAVEQVSRTKIRARFSDRRPGDPAALVADPSKALDILGWRATSSSLDEIVRTAWDWHSARERSSDDAAVVAG
jgi:UDP-arabinose 4-epimerase